VEEYCEYTSRNGGKEAEIRGQIRENTRGNNHRYSPKITYFIIKTKPHLITRNKIHKRSQITRNKK
jgi:hypothetical protein